MQLFNSSDEYMTFQLHQVRHSVSNWVYICVSLKEYEGLGVNVEIQNALNSDKQHSIETKYFIVTGRIDSFKKKKLRGL
jgi:hypothetical protein